MPERIAILGAGILGRALAYRLSQEKYQVEVFEKNSASDQSSASFAAGGMLAPFCELEHAPVEVALLGMHSIPLLKRWSEDLSPEIWFQQKGTLVVAHHRDRQELDILRRRITQLGFADRFVVTERGLFFHQEAHVCPETVLTALINAGKNLGARYHFDRAIHNYSECRHFDRIIDVRGLGAKNDIKQLRGVRGETVEVYSPEVKLGCPVRLMHPKYPVYIVPRPNHRFLIGATVVESEKTDAITVQSMAELLSAALTVHPGFAEATIIESRAQCRPAFADHLPQIRQRENVIQVNGLYRHGYLLSPVITELLVKHLASENFSYQKKDLFNDNQSNMNILNSLAQKFFLETKKKKVDENTQESTYV